MAIAKRVGGDAATHQAISLVLLAYVCALLPQSLLAPSWVDVVCLSLTGWRWYCSKHNRKLPSSTLVGVIGVTGFGIVLATSNFSISAWHGIYGLTILVACKTWYEDRREQWSTTLCLAPFILLGYFLENDPSWYIGYLAVFFWLWSAAFLCLWGNLTSARESFYKTVPAVVIAAPLVALLFFAVPKPDDIWTYLQPRATTGMSRSLKPGSIGQLTNSKEMAFSASVTKKIPESMLYWRASVLQHYDGSEWTEIQTSTTDAAWKVQIAGPQVRYRVYIDSAKDDFRYALETSSEVGSGAVRGNDVRILPTGAVLPATPMKVTAIKSQASAFVSYEGLASSQNSLTTPPSSKDMTLPAAGHPQADALALKLRDQSNGDSGRLIASLQQWFVSNKFTYSTDPGVMDGDWMDTFLFERREGFCEHYASAVTYLLRRSGIYARVVTGYQGGDYMADSKLYTIPQASAHAWLEYWDTSRGSWHRLDPTGWVAPGRLAVAGWRNNEPLSTAQADISDWGLLKTWSSTMAGKTGRWMQRYATHPGVKLTGSVGSTSRATWIGLAVLVLIGWLAVQRKWYLIASSKTDAAVLRMVLFLAGVTVARREGQTMHSWICDASTQNPELATRLDTWYAHYSQQAYAGRQDGHLGLLTASTQFKLLGVLIKRKLSSYRGLKTTTKQF
jgi:transglutaminase-like putative cysteine protease